jgi:hypothetical protein
MLSLFFLSNQDLDMLFAPCRPAAGPQGVPVAPPSPSRTRSPEPQVAGESLVDDARTATPTRGVAEGATTSPPVTDTRVGSSLHAAEGVETSAGGVGATTSPSVVDVAPIRAVLSHLIFQRKPSAYLYACQDQVSCI